MKSTIVFDLDGTLFRNNGEELCFHMENEALAAIGQPPMNRLDHIATWGQTISEALHVRAPHADLDAFLSALADVLTDYALRGEIDVISDDDLDTLYALKARGYRLMVLTNRGFYEVRHLFDLSHPLLDLVGPSCFYHVDNIPRPKPDPIAFQPLFDQHGLTPGECVYVGDSRVDVLAAVGAGMDFVGCLNGDPKHLKRFEGFEVATVNKISDVLALFPGRSSDWRQVSASNHEVETNGTEFRKTALPTNFAAAADLRTEERAWLALGIVPRWDNGRLVVPKLGEPADFNGDPRDMTAMIDHVHAVGQGTRWSGDTIYDRALTKTLRRQTPKGASLVPEPAEFDHRDRLAHGDPHEDNWVRNARRGLLLVDWESAVRATPQEALGILWASLAQDHPDAAALILEHVQNEKEFWHAAQCKAALTISWREWKNIESDAPRVIENFDHSAKLANKEVPWTYAWLT